MKSGADYASADADGATSSDAFVLTVNAQNDRPTITSAASVNAAENQTVVIDVQSTDPDGDKEGAGLSYRLTG